MADAQPREAIGRAAGTPDALSEGMPDILIALFAQAALLAGGIAIVMAPRPRGGLYR